MKLPIGEVSKIFNISKDTLRYYDKIGILTPEVDKSNGYRYYLLKHLERLGLILGIKYLGISLSDIKITIESEDISEYKNLVIMQEELIEKKIKELNQLQHNLTSSKKIIDTIINFSNEYDFSKLKVITANYTLYSVNIKNILSSAFYKDNILTPEKELTNLNEESYLYLYNIIDNNHIQEDEDMVFIKENENIINAIEKYSKENILNLKTRTINGKVISVNFYGSTDEINNYILSLNKYFKCSENNIAYIKYDFYLPKKNENILYFVNITLEL